MRVLHTSDVHIGLSRYPTPGKPYARLHDVADVMARFCWEAKTKGVDLAVIAGDLFDGRHPTPRQVALAARIAADLATSVPTVIAPGNHDGPSTVGDVTSHTLRWLSELELPNLWVPLLPDIRRMKRDGGASFVVAAMPYPHRRAFDVVLPDATPEARHEALSRAAEAVVANLHQRAAREAFGDEPTVFVGHLTAVGSKVGSERGLRLEDDVSVGSHVLDLFDYAALGHIHKAQRVGTKGAYPGSPIYVDFGEAAEEKGYLLAEVHRGEPPRLISLPSGARPMLLVDVRAGEPIPEPKPGLMAHGPIVRITVDFPDRESARRHRRPTVDAYYAAGAAHVDWQVRVPERPAAERALAPDTGPTDALIAYLRSRGEAPERFMEAARDIMAGTKEGPDVQGQPDHGTAPVAG